MLLGDDARFAGLFSIKNLIFNIGRILLKVRELRFRDQVEIAACISLKRALLLIVLNRSLSTLFYRI